MSDRAAAEHTVHLVREAAAVAVAAEAGDRLAAIVAAAIASLGVRGSAALSVVLSDDERLRALNAQYRGVDMPTDVLSFPADPMAIEPGAPPYLGDVVISVPRAAAQAAELGHSLDEELALLAVHGLLHLMGYDDATEVGADEMEALEVRLGVRPPLDLPHGGTA